MKQGLPGEATPQYISSVGHGNMLQRDKSWEKQGDSGQQDGLNSTSW